MQAYKCDCCGSLYEDYHDVEISNHAVNRIILEERFLNGGQSTKRVYDLCPSCMRKILTMLRGNKE